MTAEEMVQRMANGETLTLSADEMAELLRYNDMQEVQQGMREARQMAEPLSAGNVEHLLCRWAGNRTRWGFFTWIASTFELTADAYATGLRMAYTTGQPQNRYDALRCFHVVRDKRKLMNAEELRTLQELPARFTIYRGCSIDEHNSHVYGSSWTTERSVADFFAWRFDKQDSSRCVVSCMIDKEQVLAYFAERQEHEVVADIIGTAAGVKLEATAPTAEYLERVQQYGEHAAAFHTT